MPFFADISNNNDQPAAHVDPVAINADAVLCKASQGATYTDPYRAGWQTLLAASRRPSGNYHFHSGAASPEAQLERWKRSGLGVGELRPVIDAEDTRRALNPTAMARSVLELAERVTQAVGVEPVIYTGGWWIGEYCTRDPALARYPLWLSAYPLGDKRAPSDTEAAQWFAVGKYCAPPAPWTETFAWQFTSVARTAGVPGNCDRSVITADNFAAFRRDASAPAQPPTTPLEDDMAKLIRTPSDGKIWCFSGAGRWHVKDAVHELPLVEWNIIHGNDVTSLKDADEEAAFLLVPEIKG